MAVGEIRRDHATTVGVLGVFILLCGIGDFITGIIWIARFHITGGTGLWSGIPLIVTGVLGIIVWVKRNRGVMIGFLVMCIICVIIAAVQAFLAWLAYAIWVALTGDAKCHEVGSDCLCTNKHGKTEKLTGNQCDSVQTLVGGLLAFIILSAFGAFFSLIGSIFGCISSCGGSQTPGAVVVQQPAIVMTSPQGYPQQHQMQAPPQYSEKQPTAP